MQPGNQSWPKIGAAFVCSFACAASASSAVAGPVTWAFEGEVTLVHDPLNVLGGGVAPGSPITGNFTFESTTPGDGVYREAIAQLSGHAGTIPFAAFASRGDVIRASNDVEPLGFDHYSVQADVLFAEQPALFQLAMRDFTGLMLSGDELPIEPPSLTNIDTNFSGISLGARNEQLGVNASLSRVTLIPEPSVLLLLCFGQALCSARRYENLMKASLHEEAVFANRLS